MEDKMRKKINRAFLLVLLAVMAVAAYMSMANTMTFSDVPENYWAQKYIEAAAREGWVSGTGDKKYEPEKTVSNAEFATMIVTAYYSEERELVERSMSTEYWWDSNLKTAVGIGLLDNDTRAGSYYMGNGAFPAFIANAAISRYDMAVVLYNMMWREELAPELADASAVKTKIFDYASIPPQYSEAVISCYAAGLLSGKGEGGFAGDDSMTRAEAAVVLCRLHEFRTGVNLVDREDQNGDVAPKNEHNGRDEDGNTLAANVKTSVMKKDDFKTAGTTDIANINGYYTPADVDIGSSVLIYPLLDLVNEARAAEGVKALSWTNSDAEEEYTLLRAKELTILFSHDRPNDYRWFPSEVIAKGSITSKEVFEAWMNSPGHRRALLSEGVSTMCAARNGWFWVIKLGGEDTSVIDMAAATDYTQMGK